MKKIIVVSLMTIAAFALFAQTGTCDGTGPNGSGISSGIHSQNGTGSPDGSGQGTPAYDITLEETISGEILAVVFSNCDGSGSNGYQMVIVSDGIEIPVVMAPSAYLLLQDLTFVAGDTVTFTGIYHINANDDEVFLVRLLVFENGDEIAFRDEEGYPLWKGFNKP